MKKLFDDLSKEEKGVLIRKLNFRMAYAWWKWRNKKK